MTTYDVPDEILVASDGPIRVITLNRPDNLNATNHVLHAGLAGLWPQIDADDGRPGGGPDGRRARLLGRRRLQLHRRAVEGPRPPPPVPHAREADRDGDGPLPRADRGRRERPGGGARLQPGGALGHRLHGGVRPPGRPARATRTGGRRRRTGRVAAAHEPPAGQGVRADGGPHPRRAGGRHGAGQPRGSRRRGARSGHGVRAAAGQTAAGRGGGHEADLQHPDGAGRPLRARLRAERGGPLVHVARAAGQRGPHAQARARGA